MNIEIAETVIRGLARKGVYSFCLCPGGRLAPFVELLPRAKGLEILSFFEERSAGFFALGRAKRDRRPIAVLTTSGTAVAALLPSVIEAHYSAWPLALITADRPLDFGKKGAPQTLKSAIQILKAYCQISKNISDKKDLDLSLWDPAKGNLHLNVCFDEPLIDKEAPALDFSGSKKPAPSLYPPLELFYERWGKKPQGALFRKNQPRGPALKAFAFLRDLGRARDKSPEKNKKTGVFQSHSDLKPAQTGSAFKSAVKREFDKELKRFFKTCAKPLLLAGELKPEERTAVQALLAHYKGPFYAEPLSGLESASHKLISGEKILSWAWAKGEIDGVIRLGGAPRARFWRDLEKSGAPVLSLSSPPFYPGLSRPSFNQPLLAGIESLKLRLSSLKEFGGALRDFDQTQAEKWIKILKKRPQSEEFWLWTLKKSLKENSKVFLGNSQPIRLWDMTAFERKKNLAVSGQSGANGIDGLISRFLGECELKKTNVGIIGDLSALYDMAGFWRSKALPPWTLAAINNFGGQIFARLFKNPAFLNEHKLSFKPLAEIWGLNYSLYRDSADFSWPEAPHSLIEIRPDKADSKACFEKYVSIWDSC